MKSHHGDHTECQIHSELIRCVKGDSDPPIDEKGKERQYDDGSQKTEFLANHRKNIVVGRFGQIQKPEPMAYNDCTI